MYTVAQGLCINENGENSDIFVATLLTLDQCISKCNTNVGCNAVSFREYRGVCHGTSKKATISSRSDWICYYKGNSNSY